MTVCSRPTYFDFEQDGEIARVSLSLKQSYYYSDRQVMLGVSYESDWRTLLDIRPGEQLSMLSGQDGTTGLLGTG
jgi:hypothetical protein